MTNTEHLLLTKREYEASGYASGHLCLLEPCARNTAPAIAMAALLASARHGKDAQLLVLPADHLIEDTDRFLAAVEKARQIAAYGMLVTFGVPPTRPETAYGYIECGVPIVHGCYRAARFVEKPSAAKAEEFLQTRRFLWNSGIFCFRADAYLDALRESAPDVARMTLECWRATAPDGDEITLDGPTFAAVPDISIDYAVMERHVNVAVVQADFQWNDIGSWNALSDLTPADVHGNRRIGETITVDTEGCYIQGGERMIAAVGLRNLVIVDTPDALLVADKAKTQDVRTVYRQLKIANHVTHQIHRTVQREWGTYTVLEEGPGFKLKRIVVAPLASLSLQLHRHRSEHWVVVSGTASVVNGSESYNIGPNESTFIPVGVKHRLANCGNCQLEIIEVQVGDYVGEDDIVRFAPA